MLEQASGLTAGRDFTVGYSPERINPGDKAHRFETIQKVVAGQDARTLDIIAAVYGSVVTAGLHKAPSIKVAEAAKVIENSQRDLNIAFMNELSAIFHLLGIDTKDVLAAAATKWNFLNFTPGLVGGHCIGVDPYYLTYRAQKAGYHPDVILAGRRINDAVSVRVARECMKRLLSRRIAHRPRDRAGTDVQGERGRHPQFAGRGDDQELGEFGIDVQVHDPVADQAAAVARIRHHAENRGRTGCPPTRWWWRWRTMPTVRPGGR